MKEKETGSFYPTSKKQWRAWLKKNHVKEQSVWLICYKMKSEKSTISWSEAVDEALCFGWIDSVRYSVDDEKFKQFFGKRKPKSVWSKINKAKVQRLIDSNLMTKAGFDSIETAKQNGSWAILDDVEELTIPKDLMSEFRTQPSSKDYFLSLSKSVRKSILIWLVLAKRKETRQKRVVEIAALASKKLKPKQFR